MRYAANETLLLDFRRIGQKKTSTAVIQQPVKANIILKDVKGNKTLYRQIDFDIPVNGARFALAKGYTQYALVSAIGARSASSNFYLSLKGQTEDAISPMEFSAVHIFRPSLRDK